MTANGRGGRPPRPTFQAAVALAGLAGLFFQSAAAEAGAMEGRKLASMCATCHGLDGIAKQPDMPNISGSAASYTERQLRAYKSGERKHEVMSVVAEGLEDQAIKDLAAWYASIKVQAVIPE